MFAVLTPSFNQTTLARFEALNAPWPFLSRLVVRWLLSCIWRAAINGCFPLTLALPRRRWCHFACVAQCRDGSVTCALRTQCFSSVGANSQVPCCEALREESERDQRGSLCFIHDSSSCFDGEILSAWMAANLLVVNFLFTFFFPRG